MRSKNQFNPSLLAALSCSTIFLYLIWGTPYFVIKVHYFYWGFYPLCGTAVILLIGYLVGAAVKMFTVVWSGYQQATDDHTRKRFRALFIGYFIGYLGLVDFIAAFGINFYPCAWVVEFIYIVFWTWLMFKYELEDITPQTAAPQILKTMQGALMVVDREGKIRVVSKAACELFGRTRDQLVDKEIGTLLSLPSALTDMETLSRHPVQSHQLSFKNRDGSLTYLSISASALTKGGNKINGIVYIGDDITALVKAQQEAKLKLEYRVAQLEKMEAVGTLARGIAHDFNNILGAVQGYLYVLGNKLDGHEPAKYVAYAGRSLYRAKKLVESLLTFSNADSNKFTLLDLNDVVKSLRQVVEPLAAKGVVYMEYLSAESLVIKGDKLQLEQVVMNLWSNALDAMGKTGRLTIQTEKVRIAGQEAEAFGRRSAGDFACLTVLDTGDGIDSAIRSKVFEPFFTTKEAGKGTGLGLSIVYGVIKEHNGFIDFDSSPGGGTSFKVYLPLVTG